MILLPCRKCGGERDVLGVPRCWECMTPAERDRFGAQRLPKEEEA